jgi:hypothetical protein
MAAMDQRERHFKYIQLEHQLLGLLALFTEDQFKSLQIDQQSTLSNKELARIGLAQRNNEGKLHFNHRTVVGYIVAEFLINQMRTRTKKKKKKHVQEFLLEVLLRTDFRVIRSFLDGLLEDS